MEIHNPLIRSAIIDIGSNSIRLVVYDQQKRAPVPIYDEKVPCELGRGLAISGQLNPGGVDMAKAAVTRYLAVARNMEVGSLHIMATSAVRDAKDGGEFVKQLERQHNISIDIISGDNEARLGAYGVIASIHQPRGLAGDLGGGSFELVELDCGNIGHQATLPIGVLRLIDEARGDRDKMRKQVAKAFARLDWPQAQGEAFYAIGGSFRALAKMYMQAQAYPLQILHEYTVKTDDFHAFLTELLATPPEKLEKWPGVASKRIPALPPAALIIQAICQSTRPQQVVFSASGIREGYLYQKLAPQLRALDGLLSACRELAGKSGRAAGYGQELMQWMTPLFADEPAQTQRLRQAFCLLSDVSLHIHPEYRAEYGWHRILQSALTGISHQERVTLALAVYHRYQFKRRASYPALQLLGEQEMRWAKVVGAAANLAYQLCGSVPGSLRDCPLALDDGKPSLAFAPSMQNLAGEVVDKRLAALQEAFAGWKSL